MEKEEYQSITNVNYSQLMIKHTDQCTGLDNLEETLAYLTLQDWYNNDSTNVFSSPSTTDK